MRYEGRILYDENKPTDPLKAAPGLWVSPRPGNPDLKEVLIRTCRGWSEIPAENKSEWLNLEGTVGFTPEVVYPATSGGEEREYWINQIKQVVDCIREKGIEVGFETEPVIKAKWERFEQPLPDLPCLHWYFTAYDAALLSLRELVPIEEFEDTLLPRLERVLEEYGRTSASYPPCHDSVLKAYHKALYTARR